MISHKPRKRFGQNFLVDNQIINRIIATISPKKSDNIVEIGPGMGALTFPLLEHLDHLSVIEIDRDLAEQFGVPLDDASQDEAGHIPIPVLA